MNKVVSGVEFRELTKVLATDPVHQGLYAYELPSKVGHVVVHEMKHSNGTELYAYTAIVKPNIHLASVTSDSVLLDKQVVVMLANMIHDYVFFPKTEGLNK